MKKLFKKFTASLMAVIMVLTVIPVSGLVNCDFMGFVKANASDDYLYGLNVLPSNIPAYPENGQRFWIIFNEGYRSERLEMSTFDLSNYDSDVRIIWNESLTVENDAVVSNCNQYVYTKQEWVQIGDYHILSDKATKVFASNVDVYDGQGNLLISATEWEDQNAYTPYLTPNGTMRFGIYPTKKVTDQSLITAIMRYGVPDDELRFSTNISYKYDNEMYLNVESDWYLCEKIEWNILLKENNKYYVQSKYVLDWKPYNESGAACSWNESSLKVWLNGEFLNLAFSNIEKKYIDDYKIDGINNKVFIISEDDAVNTKYGFNPDATYDDGKRVASSTEYAQLNGADSQWCNWMLRSDTETSNISYSLAGDGCVGSCHGRISVNEESGIRPVMVMNLSGCKHVVENYLTQDKYNAETYFQGCGIALDGSGINPDVCIPELAPEYGYVPQGIGYFEERNQILISSYYKTNGNNSGEKGSKIYCLDFDTGELKNEYYLVDISSGERVVDGHVGGIASYKDKIYVANGSYIYLVEKSDLDNKNSKALSKTQYKVSDCLNGARCSYVSVCDGILWVGNFWEKSKDHNQKASENYESVILGYRLTENGEFDYTKADYSIYFKKNYVQKIQGAIVKDGRLYMNSSYGKGNASTIYIFDIDMNSQKIYPSVGLTVKGIPMLQGMFIKDGYMYTMSESGAYYYLKERSDKNPSDVVWKIDYQALTNKNKYSDTVGDINKAPVTFDIDGISGTTAISLKQSWFAQNSSVYNHYLGQLCSQFAMIGYDSNVFSSGEATKPNLEFALKMLGMKKDEIEIIGTASKDQVNYFLANRKINVDGKDYTLIFAGFIGSYQHQWYSNFDPGTGSVHKGFNNAKSYICENLERYIKEIGASKDTTKILITGHSRGAATANLVAAQLIKDEKYAVKENIYTYAFATPNSTSLRERDNNLYKRIFNIVNPEDFVTKCMPAAWGYGRYGTTFTLPSKTNSYSYSSYLSRMMNYFISFYGGKEYSPFIEGEKATYDVVSSLTSTVKNIDQFYDKKFKWLDKSKSIQEFFTETLCPFVGEPKDSSKISDATGLFIKTFLERWKSCKTILNITDFFIKYEGLGEKFGDIVYAELTSDIDLSIMHAVSQFVKKFFSYAHCAQAYCAYMMSLTESEIQIYRSGLHNSVNCPVDVEIVDKLTGEVVGRIVNNVIDEEIAAKDDAVVISVDGDSKQFWLPSDGYYDVILTGNDEGKMDYTVSEIDPDFGEVKRSNFFDVDISDGETMTGIPEIEEASLDDYELNLTETDSLDSSQILEQNAIQGIDINLNSYGKGVATESFSATSGDYVTLTAIPNEEPENNTFFGWFDNDELLSTETTYSFVVKDDMDIKAQFSRDIGDSNGDNRINSMDALRALRYSTDMIEFDSFEFNGTDVNCDGYIDSLDALMILQYSVGIITEFEPFEE